MSKEFQVFIVFESKTYTQMINENYKLVDLMMLMCQKFNLPFSYNGEDFEYSFPFYLVTDTKTLNYKNLETIKDFNQEYASRKIISESTIRLYINHHSKIWNRALSANM